MKIFHEHDTVIYTDTEGRLIDTFVVFDTDRATGLTHINHENQQVPASALQLHPRTITMHHLPMQDAFSFEIFKKLKEKFNSDNLPVPRRLKVESVYRNAFAKAS